MEEEIIRCTADIQNKIYEAGLFRPEEKVVLATKGCVLLEPFHALKKSGERCICP
ncbi:hypothetical protein QMP26_24160 [Enterocloster clostridioformis]|uniref:hypothetical protein n=1 Tax=Enterocloster clostridioformis TaxID=1531 RepID=UPI0026767C90|nr:hypothetical protein [Enterocloster clostridioformis]